ncbi:hypothetical protein [Gluconacetobacter tumulisoli]|uniref:Uncharacterized protein n=1 Tax=Gluconacetobacter tumulisoli TaxID=1286189 RepID=A0A7W4PKY3_9PROT|nr:hypothetical protein [Gluconacetobacter tumulisoli]MBB2201565.1 hypothetical protein [Gluconacetobacter tumulisoli]
MTELTPVVARRPVQEHQDAQACIRESSPHASRRPAGDRVIRGICIGLVLSLFPWAALFGLVVFLRHLWE